MLFGHLTVRSCCRQHFTDTVKTNHEQTEHQKVTRLLKLNLLLQLLDFHSKSAICWINRVGGNWGPHSDLAPKQLKGKGFTYILSRVASVFTMSAQPEIISSSPWNFGYERGNFILFTKVTQNGLSYIPRINDLVVTLHQSSFLLPIRTDTALTKIWKYYSWYVWVDQTMSC